MGVYTRGRIKWISYADPHGEIVRESTGQADHRVAERLYRQRKREVTTGTWVHPSKRAHPTRPTVAEYAERWIEEQRERGVRSIRCEAQKLRDHILPLIGDSVLDELRPKDVIALVRELRRRETLTGKGRLAPRTVRNAYAVFQRMCRDAVIDETIMATPCVLPTGALPEKRDKDPSWRARAIFTRAEVEALISDERVPWDRRVFYALLFLTGGRIGEASGRRWEHYDPEAKPLGQLVIATQYDDEPLKTGVPRVMPVHPTLAAILAEWRLTGFAMFLQRTPRPSDFIVPETDRAHSSRTGSYRRQGTSLRRLHRDLETLGLRARRQHDARRTLITIGRSDGCDSDVLRACTHGSSRDVFDDYTTWPWEVRCREVAKINIRRRGVAEVHKLVHSDARTVANGPGFPELVALPGEGVEPAGGRRATQERQGETPDRRRR